MKVTVSEIARITGGTALGAPAEINGIAFDSRRVEGGELFVPLRDERDGHEFIEMALAAGAAAYLTERADDAGPGVRVDDTRAALRALGEWARDRISGEVIAVTGSVGKTTTKDLIAAAVARVHAVHASAASFNNDIGVPHTLLGTPEDATVLVVEIGSNAPGEVMAHAAVARPTIGVVTRVAPAHTEGFGDIQAIAHEKGALIASLPSSGVAIINGDDPRVAAMCDLTSARVLTYGSSGDIRTRVLAMSETLQPTIAVDTPWGVISELTLKVRGSHQAGNASAAIAAAGSVGVGLDAIATALTTVSGPALRMDLQRAASGALVLDDSYNANPASMEAGLRALAALPARRHIAVLGIMAELGSGGTAEHRGIADLGVELGIELLAVGADEYGVRSVADIDGALSELADIKDGDAILVKGSRRAQLDKLAALLRASGPAVAQRRRA